MKEKIRKHVDHLFQDTPKTKRVFDLKEELISNLEEKYEDLQKEGTDEKQAFDNVIAGIGDIQELLAGIEKGNPFNEQLENERRKKNALIVSISIGLYLLAIVSVIVTSELELPDFVSISSFFLFVGIATCLLTYHFMSQPKYTKIDDTIVEEFKEWKSSRSTNKDLKKTVQSCLWLCITAIYFIINFAFMAWAYSWIIFLVGAAISSIIDLVFKLKE